MRDPKRHSEPTSEELREALDPSWDDLRAQRVLQNLRRADVPAEPVPAVPWAFPSWLVPAAAAVALSVVGWMLWPSSESNELRYGTHFRATLDAEADLHLVDESTANENAVLWRQGSGEVTYDIDPERPRPYLVHARDVEVRVVGTVFTVAVNDEAVRVSVERGVVEVRQGEVRTRLSAGGDATFPSAAPASPQESPRDAERQATETSRAAESPAATPIPRGNNEAQAHAPTSALPSLAAASPEPNSASRRSAQDSNSPPPGRHAGNDRRPPRIEARSQEQPNAPTRQDATRQENSQTARDVPERSPTPARAADTALEDALRQERNGHTNDARNTLRRALAASQQPTAQALFAYALGGLEQRQGRHRAAALAFSQAHRATPRSPLAEDALASAAQAWARAGSPQRAATAARLYLQRFPHGPNAHALRQISDSEPQGD